MTSPPPTGPEPAAVTHAISSRGCDTGLDSVRSTIIIGMPVNIHEAKTHLSRLVDRAAAGEEIVISRAGKPVARLVPLAPPAPRRVLGLWTGKVVVGPDFDEADEEITRLFEGDG